jgi:sugar fermentation stimulation protein A
LICATFLRRYKRFFADVRLANGQELTVYCNDPGSMASCTAPGWPCRISDSHNPRRKLRYTLEMTFNGRSWVGVNTAMPNRLVEEALLRGSLPELNPYDSFLKEPPTGAGTRADFLLQTKAGADAPIDRRKLRACLESREKDVVPGLFAGLVFVEVKGVSLKRDGVLQFPDSVTERGRRQLEALLLIRQRGARAIVFFVVQRGDASRLRPADEIDPRYAAALRDAAAAGVELYARRAMLRKTGAELGGMIPIDL